MQRNRTLAVITLLGAVASGPASAFARSVPASLGTPQFAADAACFSMSSSSMTNTCAAVKSLEFPVPVDNSGAKTVVVTAFGAAAANNVGCQAVGVNKQLTNFFSSPRLFLSQFGVATDITLNGAFVPSSGWLYANCHMNQGGRVHVINYNQ
jgi:hypothetical protein